MNFKNMDAYRKWLAAGHIHGWFASTPGNQKVTIGGKPHKVAHAKPSPRPKPKRK